VIPATKTGFSFRTTEIQVKSLRIIPQAFNDMTKTRKLSDLLFSAKVVAQTNGEAHIVLIVKFYIIANCCIGVFERF
jgi:hypothetical protein